MRESVRRFLFGLPRKILVIVVLGFALLLLGYSPLLASKVSGRVLANGQPVEGAFFYPMPGGSPQGHTDKDGRYELTLKWLDWPREVEVCVVLPDGRRTYFFEHMVSLWPCARRSLDIELGGHVPPPWRGPR